MQSSHPHKSRRQLSLRWPWKARTAGRWHETFCEEFSSASGSGASHEELHFVVLGDAREHDVKAVHDHVDHQRPKPNMPEARVALPNGMSTRPVTALQKAALIDAELCQTNFSMEPSHIWICFAGQEAQRGRQGMTGTAKEAQ